MAKPIRFFAPRWKPLCFLVLFSLMQWSHASVRSEYEIKAAFLFNFTRFVTWEDVPPESNSMTVCVFGQDPFGPMLLSLEGKVAQGREINLKYPSQLSEIEGCDVLFVSKSEDDEVARIVESTSGQPVLTVSDIPDFASSGGIIGYVKQGNVIRFEINLKAAQTAGLSINSRLLELASRVIQ